jgi:hypothetical protein
MLVAVALANRLARTAWALMRKGGKYRFPVMATTYLKIVVVSLQMWSGRVNVRAYSQKIKSSEPVLNKMRLLVLLSEIVLT